MYNANFGFQVGSRRYFLTGEDFHLFWKAFIKTCLIYFFLLANIYYFIKKEIKIKNLKGSYIPYLVLIFYPFQAVTQIDKEVSDALSVATKITEKCTKSAMTFSALMASDCIMVFKSF